MKLNLKETRYDIERLRKASDRLSDLELAYCEALRRIKIAEDALKVISTWAGLGKDFYSTEMTGIQTRALDALKLMGKP